MRPRRYTAPTTPAQATRRQQWARYLASRAWRTRREQWTASGHANTGCPGCGIALDPRRADVHHLTYPAIPGTETDEDLVLLCRGCHEAVHASLDASPAWRRTTRRDATWAILTTLRARHDVARLSTGPSPPSTGDGPPSTTPPTSRPPRAIAVDDHHPNREDTP